MKFALGAGVMKHSGTMKDTAKKLRMVKELFTWGEFKHSLGFLVVNIFMAGVHFWLPLKYVCAHV